MWLRHIVLCVYCSPSSDVNLCLLLLLNSNQLALFDLVDYVPFKCINRSQFIHTGRNKHGIMTYLHSKQWGVKIDIVCYCAHVKTNGLSRESDTHIWLNMGIQFSSLYTASVNPWPIFCFPLILYSNLVYFCSNAERQFIFAKSADFCSCFALKKSDLGVLWHSKNLMPSHAHAHSSLNAGCGPSSENLDWNRNIGDNQINDRTWTYFTYIYVSKMQIVP